MLLPWLAAACFGIAAPGKSASSLHSAADKEMQQALDLRKQLARHSLLEAIRLFTASAQKYSQAGLMQQAALAEIEAGDTFQMMSSYQQALESYRQALTMAARLPNAQCIALARTARVYANIGRSKDGAAYADKAVAVCTALPDKARQADALEARGESQLQSQEMDHAAETLTQAHQLSSEAGDREGEALDAMLLSEAIRLRHPEQAGTLLSDAIQLWNASGNSYATARARLVQATNASFDGNFAAARCYSEKGLTAFQRIDDKDNAAIAWNILGTVARQAGDIEESVTDYRLARRDFLAVHDSAGEADSIAALMDLYRIQNQYGNLLPLYDRLLHLAQMTRSSVYRGAAHSNLADLYRHEHKYALAEANYNRSLAEYREAKNPYSEGVALMRLGELKAEEGSLDEALALFEQARVIKKQTGEPEDLAKILYARARIYLRQNKLELARTEIEQTIDIIEHQRLRILSFDSRAQYFASVHDYYALYIQLLMALAGRDHDPRYVQKAFEAAEHSKVRALLDLLENSQAAPSCESVLAGNAPSTATAPDTVHPDKRDFADAGPFPFAQIQSEIKESQTLLLEYSLGEEHSYAWLLDGQTIQSFDLGPAEEIRRRIRVFRQALLPVSLAPHESSADYLRRRMAARTAFALQSATLADRLLGPIQLPPRRRVLIVPDGPLQFLPFSALSFAGSQKKRTSLIQQHELTMLPSASALAALRRSATQRPLPVDEATIFADPIFEQPGSIASANLRSASRPRELTRALLDASDSTHIPSLPGSRSEALVIQQLLGRTHTHTRLALGSDANRDSVLDGSLARQRILHFATHGMIDTQHPEMSGLVLSMYNKQGKPQDGYLRLSDIYHLRLSADLVVLSSCESALGKDLGSEGIIGLPRGFLYAGARRVVASLWKVDDAATVTLMKSFYARLQHGDTPSHALQGAQLALQNDAHLADPYYWAAFVLEGDYR
jgi:CHAT domain-containing protein